MKLGSKKERSFFGKLEKFFLQQQCHFRLLQKLIQEDEWVQN